MKLESVDERLIGFWTVRKVDGEPLPCVVRIYPDERAPDDVVADLHFWKPGLGGPLFRTSDVGVLALSIGHLENASVLLSGTIHKKTGEQREFRLDGLLDADGSIRGTLADASGERSVILSHDPNFEVPIRIVADP